MMQIDINELIDLVKRKAYVFKPHRGRACHGEGPRRFRDAGRYPCAGIYAKGTVKALARGTVYKKVAD